MSFWFIRNVQSFQSTKFRFTTSYDLKTAKVPWSFPFNFDIPHHINDLSWSLGHFFFRRLRLQTLTTIKSSNTRSLVLSKCFTSHILSSTLSCNSISRLSNLSREWKHSFGFDDKRQIRNKKQIILWRQKRVLFRCLLSFKFSKTPGYIMYCR